MPLDNSLIHVLDGYCQAPSKQHPINNICELYRILNPQS